MGDYYIETRGNVKMYRTINGNLLMILISITLFNWFLPIVIV